MGLYYLRISLIEYFGKIEVIEINIYFGCRNRWGRFQKNDMFFPLSGT